MTTKISPNLLSSGTATAGQVQTADGSGGVSYADPAGGGSMVLLGSYTASNATSVDIGSGLDLDVAIDGTYDHYVLECISVRPATTSVDAWLRTSTDGGSTFDSSTSDYKWSNVSSVSGNTNTFVAQAASDSEIELNGSNAIYNSSSYNGNYIIDLYSPADSTKDTLINYRASYYTVNAEPSQVYGAGSRRAENDVDAVRFLFSSGNIAEGTFYLYGIAKA